MNQAVTLGDILRAARERKGLSPSEAAEGTRLKVQHIEDLERNDFRRIPAPVYCKGFIKLYAEFLGLDPAPLIREYTARHAVAVRPSLKAENEAAAQRVAAAARARPRSTTQDFARLRRALYETVVRPCGDWLASLMRRAQARPKITLSRWPTLAMTPHWRQLVPRAAAAAGGLALLILLVVGVVRLAHRPSAAPRPVAAQPAGADKAAPLRLAEEPPAPYFSGATP
jgi:transcriptional regulator with XRE-family HTH domain